MYIGKYTSSCRGDRPKPHRGENMIKRWGIVRKEERKKPGHWTVHV
jgi:hypothetical protein